MMQLQLNKTTEALTVHSVEWRRDAFCIKVGGREYHEAVMITPSGVKVWQLGGGELSADDIEQVAQLADETAAEVVVLGSGRRLVFPQASVTRALTARQLGVEVMDTRAACRTFNALVADGRRVLAALVCDAR